MGSCKKTPTINCLLTRGVLRGQSRRKKQPDQKSKTSETGDFFNPARKRFTGGAFITARLVLPTDPGRSIIQSELVLIDMVRPTQTLLDIEETRDTLLRDPVQIYVATTSDLSESRAGDSVGILGRISPNPGVLYMDVSLDIEGTGRTETQQGIYILHSGLFQTSFEVAVEEELSAGDWVMQAGFDNTNNRRNPVEGRSPQLRIAVGKLAQAAAKRPPDGKQEKNIRLTAAEPIPGVGRAFIAFGPSPRPEVEAGWRATYNGMVQILKQRRFTDITLLSFSDADGSPATLSQLQTSLRDSVDADIYTVVLAGPNDPDIPGSVELSDSDIISPGQIGPLMKIRFDALQTAGQQGKTIFIIETRQAGITRDQMMQDGFSSFVDGPDGYVFTSTGEKLLNISLYGISSETGEFICYLRFLVDAIAKGSSIGDAHEQAASSLTRLQGPMVFAFPQPIPALMPVGPLPRLELSADRQLL